MYQIKYSLSSLVMSKEKINYITSFVLIIYPLVIFLLGAFYWKEYGIGKFEILCTIISFYIFCISVGVGIHRLWAHGSYKTNKIVEFILAVISAGTLQGPVLAWASDHDKHHTHTDVLGKDPHTPLKYCILENAQAKCSIKNRLKGFFWSHIGWMIFGESSQKHIATGTLKRLGKNKIIMWQFKHYWKIATLVNTVLPFCIGYAIGGDLQYGLAGFIFMGIGRAVQQQATFCINSLAHFFGSKKYTNVTAGDIPILFFMFLGENWHNFHHAFPRDYRNGHKWYHLDVHKWIIALMEKLGLAKDVVRTSEERIKAKIEETKMQFISNSKRQLDKANALSDRLLATITEKLDDSLLQLSTEMKNKLKLLKQEVLFLKVSIKNLVRRYNKIKKGRIEKVLIKLEKLELEVHSTLGMFWNKTKQAI